MRKEQDHDNAGSGGVRYSRAAGLLSEKQATRPDRPAEAGSVPGPSCPRCEECSPQLNALLRAIGGALVRTEAMRSCPLLAGWLDRPEGLPGSNGDCIN
jgi:hypothetical protein